MSDYPEHEKLQAVKDESQAAGAFLWWLRDEKGLFLCGMHDDYNFPVRAGYEVEKWLAEYFEIDLEKIEEEKRAMIDRLREMNS